MTMTQKELYTKRIDFLKSLRHMPSKKNLEHLLRNLDFNYQGASDFDYVDDDSTLVRDVMIDLNAGNHVMLIGPKAAGKNTLIDNLGRLYTKRVREIQCHAYTDMDALFGYPTLRSKEGQTHPELIFVPSELVLAMEAGDFLVLDEMNTVNPAVLAALNSILDKRRRVYVPGYGLVNAHEQFRVFATMNEGYHGVLELNEATMSRFSIHHMDLPKDISKLLAINCPEAKHDDIRICQRLYEHMLYAVNKGTLTRDVINIRGFVYALERTLWEMPIKSALKAVIHGISNPEDRDAVNSFIAVL